MRNITGKILSPWLILLGIVLAVGGSVYFFYTKKIHDKQLIVHGNVDIRQVELGFRVAGRIEKMHFEEGDTVKKGDVLASLDKTPFQHDVDNLKAQVAAAQANLTKYNTGNRPQEIQEAIALVNQQQATYDNASKVLTRKKELLEKNYASKQEYDDAFATANEAQARLKTAQEALKLMKEGFRTEDIEAASAQFEAMKAQLSLAQIRLQDSELLAPNDGIILTRIKEPGAIVPIGTPVYTLSLTNPVWIRAYVSEIDLGRLKPGMSALVYTDTAPDKPFKGQVGFISPQAEFTPKNIETKELRTDLVYRIRIIVDDKEGQLRQGMPVTATLLENTKLNHEQSR
ncbi:MAG: secretion protein HlyD [Proteobacteria bacterium]|nr:secretion protein HlyD [Pseudomonadota bacterium]